MSIIHGSNIVRNGLAIQYDAANIKSYPGSGSSIYDLSGNGRGATLGNDVAVESLNGGRFAYDGVNDYLNTNDPQSISTSIVSAMVWVQVDSHRNYHSFINNNLDDNGWVLYASESEWRVGGITDGGVPYNTGSAHGNSTAWTNLCFTFDATTVRFYVNGQQTATVTPPGDTTIYVEGASTEGVSLYKTANMLVYDRALTSAEVQQNFEATRSRFGI